MTAIGVLLAIVGVLGLLFGLLQKRKSGKLAAVPFHPPSRIAQQGASLADAKGMISTEGRPMLAPQPLIAPMSGKPCIAYEIEIEQEYEYYEQTDKGPELRKKTEKSLKKFCGSSFQLGDGMGAVLVEVQKEPEATLTQSFRQRVDVGMMIPGQLQFGQGWFQTPLLTTEGAVKSFTGTERILEASPVMFALGQLTMGGMGPLLAEPKGMFSGRLLLETRTRDAVLGATARNAKIGLIAGAALMGVGGILGVVGALTHSGEDTHAEVVPNNPAQNVAALTPEAMQAAAMQAAAAQAAAAGAQAAAAAAGAQAAGAQAAAGAAPSVPEIPAGFRTPRVPLCRQTMLCCLAANRANPSSCSRIANLTERPCRDMLTTFTTVVQATNPSQIAACQ